MAGLIFSLLFIGVIAAVLWTIWKARAGLADLPGSWQQVAGRALGVAVAAGAVMIGISLFQLHDPAIEPPGALFPASVLLIAGIVLGVASLTPSSSRLVVAAMVAGWLLVMIILGLSFLLGFLLPLAAVGSASFMWSRPRVRHEVAS